MNLSFKEYHNIQNWQKKYKQQKLKNKNMSNYSPPPFHYQKNSTSLICTKQWYCFLQKFSITFWKNQEQKALFFIYSKILKKIKLFFNKRINAHIIRRVDAVLRPNTTLNFLWREASLLFYRSVPGGRKMALYIWHTNIYKNFILLFLLVVKIMFRSNEQIFHRKRVTCIYYTYT